MACHQSLHGKSSCVQHVIQEDIDKATPTNPVDLRQCLRRYAAHLTGKDATTMANFANKSMETCTKCGKANHTADKCWSDKICEACQQLGHIAKFCPNLRKAKKAARKQTKQVPSSDDSEDEDQLTRRLAALMARKQRSKSKANVAKPVEAGALNARANLGRVITSQEAQCCVTDIVHIGKVISLFDGGGGGLLMLRSCCIAPSATPALVSQSQT